MSYAAFPAAASARGGAAGFPAAGPRAAYGRRGFASAGPAPVSASAASASAEKWTAMDGALALLILT
jgi:hypothetical protein